LLHIAKFGNYLNSPFIRSKRHAQKKKKEKKLKSTKKKRFVAYRKIWASFPTHLSFNLSVMLKKIRDKTKLKGLLHVVKSSDFGPFAPELSEAIFHTIGN
jgi:hypothetical protein